MNGFDKEEDKKKGFLPFLGRIFGGGAKSAATMGRTIGSAGATGLFSKAGMLGIVLGGATIAAGVGVVYNFISPSSGKVYTPDLFQNAYYQEQARKASMEREGLNNMASQSASSLDMFREQAKKEGLAVDEESASSGENPGESGSTSDSASSADESASSQDVAVSQGETGGKLNAALGFNNSKGGGSSMKRLQTSGGIFGSIGKKQFSPIGGSANFSSSGKASSMKGALASNIKNSPKYTVPNIKRRGAFGQAKYAGKVGQKAAYSASDSAGRTAAEEAFTGETAGSGDVAAPIGGTGIGGAGLSDGAKLKANDPNINTNEYTPPTPKEGEKDSPWKALEDKIFTAILIAAGLVALATLMAKSKTPWALALASVFAYAAIAAALYVIYLGYQMHSQYQQKWTAIMYGLVGAAIIYSAMKALSAIKTTAQSAEFVGEWNQVEGGFWKSFLGAVIPGV